MRAAPVSMPGTTKGMDGSSLGLPQLQHHALVLSTTQGNGPGRRLESAKNIPIATTSGKYVASSAANIIKLLAAHFGQAHHNSIQNLSTSLRFAEIHFLHTFLAPGFPNQTL